MVRLLGPVSGPPEPFEEADVCDLDVRLHDLTPMVGGRRHRESDQIRTELVDAELRIDRESIAQPDVRDRVHRVEAHRADDALVRRADEVDRVAPLVEPITIGRREDALLDHEDRVPDGEVVGQVRRTAGDPALRPDRGDLF